MSDEKNITFGSEFIEHLKSLTEPLEKFKASFEMPYIRTDPIAEFNPDVLGKDFVPPFQRINEHLIAVNENIFKLNAMIQAILSLLTQDQIAAFPLEYERQLSALRMQIVSSNQATDNSQE